MTTICWKDVAEPGFLTVSDEKQLVPDVLHTYLLFLYQTQTQRNRKTAHWGAVAEVKTVGHHGVQNDLLCG